MANKAKSSSKMSNKPKNKKSNNAVCKFCRSVQSFIKSKPIIVKMSAELIGVFMLALAFLQMQSSPIYIGFALAGIVMIVVGVSGAHLNPAMSIAACINRKIKGLEALGYVVAQMIGAGLAYLVANGFAQNQTSSSLYLTSSLFKAAELPDSNLWYLFFAEVLGTAILAIGVSLAIRVCKNRVAAGLIQGFTILAALYIAMSVSTVLLAESYATYTFLNPALAFAGQAFSWNIWAIAIFILAPIIGAIIGFSIQSFLSTEDKARE